MEINILLLTITLACVPALGLLETSTSITPLMLFYGNIFVERIGRERKRLD